MTHVAARHGYAEASVARVVERAGVSRATFYQHFRDREDCFAAACEEALAGFEGAVDARASGASEGRPRAVLEAICGQAAAAPPAARLVLVEAAGSTPAIGDSLERARGCAAAAIEDFLKAESSDLALSGRALLGGVLGVLGMRVFDGEAGALPGLVDELSGWIECYRLGERSERWPAERWEELGTVIPPVAVAAEEQPARLPRGRSALPGAEVARALRDRIIGATTVLCAEHGYANLSVAMIVSRAGVTRGAFYTHFRGKREAFLAAQTIALQESIAAAAGEFFGPREWPERVWGAAAATLGYIAGHPDLAALVVLEAPAAGEEAIQRQHDMRVAYTVFLEEGYRECAVEPPRICSEAIAWAVFGLMRDRIVRGQSGSLPQILPEAAFVILAPFIGPAAATAFVEARTRSAG